MGPGGAIELAAAIAAAIAALLLLARRMALPSAWLLLATAATMPFAQAQPTDAALLALALVVGGAGPVLAAAAGVLWPIAPTAPSDRVTIGSALVVVLVLGGVVPAVVYDPAAAGCNACAPNPLEVGADPALADALARVGAAAAIVWGPAFVLVAARRIRAASPLARRQAWPAGAGAGIAVLAAISGAYGLALPTGSVDAFQDAIAVLRAVLVLVIAAGAVVRVYLAATAGRRMGRIVLASIPDEALIVGSLRRAAADPTLGLRYIRADGSAVGADGEPVDPWDGPTLRLSRDGRVFAEVRHAPEPEGAGDQLRSSAASAGLAIEYLAARARLRAELLDAVAVRSRLVERGDAERRRLERNLHDGAQQRLVALGLMLTATSMRGGVRLDAEHAEVDRALQQLRTVAHGLFPAGLAESDMRAALRELGDHTACPVQISGDLDGPVPLAVKAAVYQLVDDVARLHPVDAALQVELAGGGSATARITVRTAVGDRDVLRGHVIHAEDRFVAAGGSLRVLEDGAGTMVRGEAPCAS